MNNRDNVFIIAEAGVNHNGSLTMAKELVDRASEAGADAVKFQTFKAEKLTSKFAEKAKYQKQTTDVSESQLEMLKKFEMDIHAHMELVQHCKERDILFLSTPFDLDSVDLLVEQCGVTILKVSSGEITNGPLLLKMARTGLPIIMSSGMAVLGEIEEALGVLAFGYTTSHTSLPSREVFREAYSSEIGQQVLKEKVSLLHCTTEYPATFSEVNLRIMDTLHSAFGLSVGYSDHTEGIAVPVAAVARGAEIIEKHFTLDRNLPGPDHRASLEPHELALMVKSIRQVERALGSNIKFPTQQEIINRQVARKSLVAACDIQAGEIFTENNLTSKRPGNGISPMEYWNLLYTRAQRNYKQDEVII